MSSRSWLIKSFLFCLLFHPMAHAGGEKEACKASTRKAETTCDKGTSGTQAAGSAISAQGAMGQSIGSVHADQCRNQKAISDAKKQNAEQFASDCDAAIMQAVTKCMTCNAAETQRAQQKRQEGQMKEAQQPGSGQPDFQKAQEHDKNAAECMAEKAKAEAKRAKSALARQQAGQDGANSGVNSNCQGDSSTSGGGLPQLPQMPQMPQNQNKNQNGQQQNPTGSSPTSASCVGEAAKTNPACGGTNPDGSPRATFGTSGGGLSTSSGTTPSTDAPPVPTGETSIPGQGPSSFRALPGGSSGTGGSGSVNFGTNGSTPIAPGGKGEESKGKGDGSPQAGFAGDGGGGGSMGSAPGVPADPQNPARGPKRPLSGFTKNFKGEKIGVAADNIFDMISHRYKALEANRKLIED